MLASFGAIVAFAVSALAQSASLVINTPTSLVECEPSAITFSGGTAPYYISVLPGGQTTASPLETFPTQTAAGTYTWTVNLQPGLAVTLQIRDSTGALNYAQEVTIQSSSISSCLLSSSGASGSTAAASSGTSATSSGAGTSAAAASSTTSATTTSEKSSTSAAAAASSTTAAAATSAASSAAAATTKSAANALVANIPNGVAVLVGGLVLALLA